MRRDISIITERRHLSPEAVFFKYSGALYNKAERVTADGRAILSNKLYKFAPLFKDRFNKQWNSYENISGARLRKVANRNRQKKKGPLVRFGGRVYSNEV